MADGAKVNSVSVLTDVKVALVDFADQVRRALSETLSDAQRVKVWLEHEQTVHWQQEIRKRTAKVAEAKSELYRAQMQSREERPSCVLERKNLVRAEDTLREATEKLQKTKRWAHMLDRELMLYRGSVQQISASVEQEIPVALARLERMVDALAKYLSLQADASASNASTASHSATADTPSPDPTTAGDSA